MNDIFVLDEDLEMIGLIDSYSSLIWANRYDEDGDCELYIEANEYNLNILRKGYFLMRNDDDMVCEIKKIDIDTDVEIGNYLTITAIDVKNILNQRIIWNQTNVDGKVEDCIYKIIDENLINPKVPERIIKNEKGRQYLKLDNKQNFIEVMTGQTAHKNVKEKVQELCRKYGWGYKVKVKDKDLYFSLYKGIDRSDKVIFSPDFENLSTSKYTDDVTNLANVALVGGEGEGSKRSKNISGSGVGKNRYEIFVDAKDISKTITWEELTKMYPTTENKGQGYIAQENGQYVYKMNYIDIAIVDNQQLSELKNKYPDGKEITKKENKYFQIHNVAIAELSSNQPEESEDVILKDIIYSVYLLTRGYERLAEYGEVETFEGKIEPKTTFEYKKDYFLGDIVTVRNEFGIEKKVRITEIVEVQDENGYTVEPKFKYMEENKNV